LTPRRQKILDRIVPLRPESSVVQFITKTTKIQVYRIIILPVLVYGYETWFLTLTEGHRPRVFENRVLRKRFEPKRDEVEAS